MANKLPAKYWELPVGSLFASLESGSEGLTSEEAKSRLKVHGENVLTVDRNLSVIRLLLRQFASPLVLILIFAVLISALVGEWIDAAVISVIVIGSATIAFVQEYTAGNAVARLRERLVKLVTVTRDGLPTQVASERIVPGDVVLLSAGSVVPADGVVIEAQECFADQSALTGESFPVEKTPGPSSSDAEVSELSNVVFMGSFIRSGTARVIIVRTAAATQYGQIASELSKRQPETEFESGIRKFGIMLSRVMIALIISVFAVNALSAKPIVDSLLFAIALAVGLSPELLPAIITINLSKGARAMATAGVIVRRLASIEDLGSMDVLCTDKTGTLTEGVVRLDAAYDVNGAESSEVGRLAYLNAKLQTGMRNPLDEAIITSGGRFLSEKVEKLGEIPYDFERKRLSVLVGDSLAKPLLITKGAFENVLEVCSHAGGRPIGEAERARLSERFQEWGENGYRVLGLATRIMENEAPVTAEDESGMDLSGFLLFFDPPKDDVRKTLEDLTAIGVELKIITGDNRHVAGHVARSVGLSGNGILTGKDLAKLDDEELKNAAERSSIFVEVAPDQKERIIRALKANGHVVGYMGDGINDAPALHDADVGISVDGAVEVAREAADLVLLRKGLDILIRGIEEGRTTFANSLKYVFTTTSANFGNMISMAAASIFLPFLPLLAKQILLNNFLSDIPALAIASDNVDKEYLARPHRWDIRFIRNFMIVFGAISSFFDILTFGILLWVVNASVEEFRTGWFIESLLTELAVALVVRTRYQAYKSKPALGLWLSTAIVAAITIAIPYLPGVSILGFVPLPLHLTILIVGITVVYAIVTDIAKVAFYNRFYLSTRA